MWPNPQETADLVTFTKKILKGKLHFLFHIPSQLTHLNPRHGKHFLLRLKHKSVLIATICNTYIQLFKIHQLLLMQRDEFNSIFSFCNLRKNSQSQEILVPSRKMTVSGLFSIFWNDFPYQKSYMYCTPSLHRRIVFAKALRPSAMKYLPWFSMKGQ